MARLRAQCCLLTRVTRQYGSLPTSDLLGVCYFWTIPADAEFPCRLGTLDLYVRFFGVGPLASRVRVTVTRLHPDGTDRERVYWNGYGFTVPPGTFVHDRSLKLHGVVVPGEGRYVVRVARRARHWGGTRRWQTLAADYFSILRAP